MFCDRCGAPITINEVFCPSCGKQVNPAPRPAVRLDGRVERHLRMLAIFWLAYSTLRLLGGWFFTRFVTVRWGAFWRPFPLPFLPGILHGVGMMLMTVGIMGLVAGWGLHERQPWARTLAIVLGFVVLLNFGLGTVLGIYTLWVLLPAESEQEYQRLARVM